MRLAAQLFFTIFSACLSFHSMAETSSRIINGSDTAFSEIPWQVLVKLKTNSGTYRCGGTAVDKGWIVTAAHCVDVDTISKDGHFQEASYEQVFVSAGHSRLDDAMALSNEIPVSGVYIHPGYSDITYENDIALIKVRTGLPHETKFMALADASVQASLDSQLSQMSGEKEMSVTGWGLIDNFQTEPDNLQIATVVGVDDSNCSWTSKLANSAIICADSSPSGVCNGDSGGPLIWKDPVFSGDPDNGRRLVGVVSFGLGICGLPGAQDAYTEVASYLDWIDRIRNENPDTNFDSLPFGSGSGGSNHWLWLIVLALIASVRKVYLPTRPESLL